MYLLSSCSRGDVQSVLALAEWAMGISMDRCRSTVLGSRPLLLLGSCSRCDRTVGVGGGGRCAHRLGFDDRLVSRTHLAFLARGDIGLGDRCLRIVGVRHGTQWAAARSMADGGLSPTLVLEGHCGAIAEILLELVAVGALSSVVERGTSVRQSALTPGLSGVFVLGRAELASSLGLLLEGLLLRGVGVADLDLKLLGGGLDGVIVEGSDDFFTSLAVLEATRFVSMNSSSNSTTTTYRANPTPRPRPCRSRRMRAEQTLCGAKRFPSACSFMVFGRLET